MALDISESSALMRCLTVETESFLQYPVLQNCRDCSLTKAEFDTVALARFGNGAPVFENLLLRAVGLSKRSTNETLHRTFEDNLKDERGVTGSVRFTHSGSHAAWRADFLKELIPQTPSAYETYMADLSAYGSLSEITGAILWLEYSIPQEFKIMLDYLRETQQALFYLGNHIKHDAHNHFPVLLKATENAGLEEAEILMGIRRMAQAKGEAYYQKLG